MKSSSPCPGGAGRGVLRCAVFVPALVPAALFCRVPVRTAGPRFGSVTTFAGNKLPCTAPVQSSARIWGGASATAAIPVASPAHPAVRCTVNPLFSVSSGQAASTAGSDDLHRCFVIHNSNKSLFRNPKLATRVPRNVLPCRLILLRPSSSKLLPHRSLFVTENLRVLPAFLRLHYWRYWLYR